jgi:uncharacterized membrane protein YbhN (UPF0104 family)
MSLRLRRIIDAIGARPAAPPFKDVLAITMIATFFSQVLPNVAGDAMRVWLLTINDVRWRSALTAVVLDRIVGVLVLFALGFFILLFPSALTGLGGYRDWVVVLIGLMLAGGLLCLFAVPFASHLLERWPPTHLLARFLAAANRLLFGPHAPMVLTIALVIHLFTILAIWFLSRSQGLALPAMDVAALFAFMLTISLIPLSVSGWGLREVAVTALLQSHGFSAERALLFSISFGLAILVASSPGAIVWALYSPARKREPATLTE